MADFCMPSLGADMRTGTLVEWKVKPGDRLKRGDIIADVETDKGIMEIEVFEDIIVDELLTEPNTEVPVGTVMAKIHPQAVTEAEVVTAGLTTESKQPPIQPIEETPIVPTVAKEAEKRLRVSPLARRLADELGVDLSDVRSHASDGIIQRVDVEQAAAALQTKAAKPAIEKPVEVEIAPIVAKPTTTVDFQVGMRRAIAAAMSLSNRDIPHYYLETRIDMSHPLQWLEAENQKRSIKERILPIVLLIKATAKALIEVPELNGYWIDDHLQLQEAIHIGFAISLRQGGLVTPAIHHADLKNLDELMTAMRDLIERTRGGRLRSSEMSDATITLTNLGDMGVEKVFGVIYPPQVALVGFGKISEQPWAERGMLDVRPVLTATLAGDHRATDGIVGARFLQALNTHLQAVEKL
ncbi:dihydrolipoamide acetyltransferase family protein [Nostoc sp. FACHB-133]|uniref:dihydrolipoamide acetyltransferase family protein n=1 Tax=Nostoc sp. FACHB-133 TaxID=2692835 RepID=UPI001689FA38|nr:dihydrolipoamide acetyltransferase family protein [Nostoc sp. FACHB-133]MBD2525816.1 2-oxo acid dehydrogenase subunit E2 [Nostoc sp. FACHB-133]